MNSRRSTIALLIVVGVFACGWYLWQAAEAARHDDRRRADLNQIKDTLAAQPPLAELPADVPKDPKDSQAYQYKAAGNEFVACATMQQYGQRRAYFVTRTGSFEADRRYCETVVEPGIATIITDTKLTDRGTQIFLETNPTIADKETIKRECATSGEKVALYGCYDEEGKIWILRVDDPELRGVSTVAAVHELMHAVQYRTPPNYQRLLAQAEKLNDKQLNDELNLYTVTERASEVHARLGTEYPQLDPDIEAEYAQYFDRASVIAIYQPYADLLRELQSLRSRLDAQKARMDELERQENIDAFNAMVGPYNDLVDRHNGLARRYNLLTE